MWLLSPGILNLKRSAWFKLTGSTLWKPSPPSPRSTRIAPLSGLNSTYARPSILRRAWDLRPAWDGGETDFADDMIDVLREVTSAMPRPFSAPASRWEIQCRSDR